MEILRQPDSLSLLGNLKEFLISSSENVTFALSTEIDGVPTTLITESYIPDAAGRISIDVTEICRQYLKTELPGDNVVAQENAARTFTATIGATSVSFRVVNSSVRNLALTPTDYLEYNFLTLQPQTKKVSWHSPEYLSYYFMGTADIKAKFYLVSGDTETVTVASITPELEPGENGNGGTIRLVNKVYTVNTTLSRLMALSSHSTDELQGIVDVWVEQFGDRKSYIQRYVYAPATGEEHHYLSVNSLGGIDTFTFHGEQKISGEIEHQVAENSDLKISVTQDGQRKYRQTTGYLGAQDAEWLWEFLHSNQQWVVADGTAEAIALQSSSLSQGDITALNSSSFDFVLAREGGLLPESRRDETFPDITVPSPVSDLFFLTPRLIDFPAASGDSEIVFPVQTPYSNTWKYLTLSALSEKLSLSIIPDHTHGNLSILNELGEVDGHLTYRGSAIGSGNGITLPIAITDVDGLRTVLNSKAASNHTHNWTDISDRPLRLSDFTNDIISSWALAASKPSYSWSEIGSKPNTLSGYGITDGYSSLSTTGSGNAITGVSGSGHALTFTKGNTFVDLASEQTISGKKHISYLDVTGALAIPQVEPTAESGKVFEYIDNSGSFGKVASAVTPADLKDLTLKINGVTKTTYNPSSAASFNVDLTDYATQSWVEAKNYLQAITKAMVEAVLTGNITSHTHSQYLTSHQSLSGYATQTWVQQQGYLTSHQSLANYYTKTQADAKFLTEHQSLENYALKSEIPTSMAWTAITGRPTKLSQFTNDIISSWALAATKPSYSWSEIGSKPNSLSGYGITDGTPKIEAIPYIVGPSSDETAGTWTGSYTGIIELTEGLTIIYVPAVAGASTTTLNINGLGAKTCYYSGTSKLTTHYPVGTPILLTYHNNGWRRADYNSNTTYSAGTKDLFDAGANTTNRVWSASVLASAVAAKEHSHLWADITDSPSKLSDFTNDLISSWALAATKPDYSWSEIGSKPTTLSGYGITDGYSSLSTTGSGNAITGVSGSGHALTFTKGNTFVDLASEQTISGQKHISYLDVTGALAIPQVEPTAESGKVFEYIDNSGSFGEVASAVTPADLKDLTLKINGVVKTTYNPSSAASFNVDLTDYATQSWVEAKNYLQGITKAMVEAVLTGNITSHTHSQYLTSHQSLSGYATQTWVQQQGYLTSHQSLSNYYTKTQADAKFLTEHQSLENYALKSEIPTSMAWTAITGRPTKLSDLTNDIISSWALAASKPSYSWSEITSRPTALSAFSEDSTHRLVTDSQISAWNRSYGELILGTQTAATGSWTGVSSLATASDMTSGYRFTYWLPYAGSGNATLTLTFGDGTTKTFNLYLRGASRLTTHFPAGSKIDFVYLESVSVAGSSTKYTGAWPDAYYDTTYSAGTKALFDAGTNTANRVWSASVLASAVAAKEHSHLWADITDSPSKLSDFTNDLISSWALAATKPSYSWTEIASRPTTLASFSGDSTHRLVTDTQISNWNSAYGWGNHADAGYLTSFTESDPTVPAWAKTASKPSYTLDEVTDGSTRKLSNYVPTTRTINSKALSSNITLTLDDIANGTTRSLANYLPLSGGTLTGNLIFNTSSSKGLYSNNGTLNQRVLLMSSNGDLSIGDELPANSKSLYLYGYQTYLSFGTSKNYSMTLWSDGTIRSSTGANQLSLGYRSGNTIYPFKNVYSTFNVSTKCAGTIGGTMLYGVARFSIQNTKKARTFAIKIPSSMGAYVTFKIVLYSPFNLSPSSTITVSAGAFNLTAGAYCALYPSCSIEGSFAGRVAFARDGNTSSANMYILLGSCNDTNALYQGGMIAIDSIIHADSITNADTIMNFGYELLDLDSESMFTKITECVNADAHFKSVTVEDHVTAPKIDCTSMMLVPTIEPSSVPVGKVAEYIDLTGSFAN